MAQPAADISAAQSLAERFFPNRIDPPQNEPICCCGVLEDFQP
jgi:hypothetical protein